MTNDPIETIEMSSRDEDDLARLLEGGKEPEFHTVLEVWREVLVPTEKLSKEKVTPQWASKMVASYPGLTFADMAEVQDRYYAKIGELLAILQDEIASDRDCLTYTKAEDDARENAKHYKNLLREWQIRVLTWELDWDTTAFWAPIELAAISEVHKLFFGQTGMVPYLDNIKFEFSDQDRDDLAADLIALRESRLTDE